MVNLLWVIIAIMMIPPIWLSIIPSISTVIEIMWMSTEARADDIAAEFASAKTGTVPIEPFELAPGEFAIQLLFDDACLPFMYELFENGSIMQNSRMGSECNGNVCFCIGKFSNVGCQGVEKCSPNPVVNDYCGSRTCLLNWSDATPSWIPISNVLNISDRVIYTTTPNPLGTLSSLCRVFFTGAFGYRTYIESINCGSVGETSYITVDDGSCSGGCEYNLFLWVRPNSEIGEARATGVGDAIKTEFTGVE